MLPWLTLKVVHIVAGVFWLGGVVILSGFVMPAIMATGASGGAVMRQLMTVQKMPVALSAAAGLTVLSGIGMYAHVTDGFRAPLLGAPLRVALFLGIVFGLAGFVWGIAVQTPAAARLGKLASTLQGPPTPEQATMIAELQQRLRRGGKVGSALLLLSLIGMALSHPI